MTDIQQRIADVLREHLCSWSSDRKNWTCSAASCDWFGRSRDFEGHVAAVLVSELGLDEATVNPWTGQPL